MKLLIAACYAVCLNLYLCASLAGAEDMPLPGDWQELKGKHFVVIYSLEGNRKSARTILRRAEEYYDKIARSIGYSRYAHFWTWEERVKIVIFPDQDTFRSATGQPAWSLGYAVRDSQLFRSRIIVTYRHEFDFLDGLLPHEISHLIIRDFIGFEAEIPVWFDEGVAQLFDADKKIQARDFMQNMVEAGSYVPFSILHSWDVRREKDPQKVMVFYAQSVSVVDFLITRYGSDAFGRLCREMKDGKNFEEALRSAYTNTIDSLADLEAKWLGYLVRQGGG